MIRIALASAAWLLASISPALAAAPSSLPLEARVAAPPAPFPSQGRRRVLYELHLTNRGDQAVALERIEILGDGPGPAPLEVLSGEPLLQATQAAGGVQGPDRTTIAPGASTVLYMDVTLGADTRRLHHRIVTGSGELAGAEVGLRPAPLKVFGSPFVHGSWLAGDGPSNRPDNHHRRGLAVVDGRATISRRFAIDWQEVKDGKVFSGDARDLHAYPSYGEPLLAVADARVVAARDGLPDNQPGHGRDFHPAAPLTLDSSTGNMVVLDVGDGQYAHYFHLLPGSLKVKAGERVRRGQEIGRVGASGDAREPHLHFELTDSPTPMAGEGLPYLIGKSMPLDAQTIDFSR